MANQPPAQPSIATDLLLQGQAAVVSGASTGIGRAIAIRLAELGADVFIHARAGSEELATTAASIRDHGRDTDAVLCDLASTSCDEPSATESLIEAAYAWRDEIDIWINNAGADVLTDRSQDNSFHKKLWQLWQVDVLATMRLSRTVGQKMMDNASEPGAKNIINIGWDQALTGMGGDSGQLFATTKGAVISFTRSLAKSLAPAVRVNCVAPGWIQTEWGRSASESWDRRARRESLLGRWGQPKDVAAVVAFLVSPAAAFVNAQVIEVNGGFRGAEPPA